MDLPSGVPDGLVVRSLFVRHRNALAVRAHFGALFTDYYLHLLELGVTHPPALDAMLKEALVAVTLHAASRPWKETHAWTINVQKPLANIFATADNTSATITGRLFTEDVKVAERSMFYAQVQKPSEEPRMSIVEIEGASPLHAAEQFYARSEQRLARFCENAPDDFIFLSAQPQCDLPWLGALTDEAIRRLDQDEELSLLEERSYHWKCGCNLERIQQVLSPHARSGMDALFAGDEFLRVTCPRCGMLYRVHREQFEAWLEEHPAPSRVP